MLIKIILLIIIGTASGVIVAGGIFAFITTIGVINRLAAHSDSADKIHLYEDIVVLGATFGNIVILFQPAIPFGIVGLIIFGLFSGCYVGCTAVALAEVTKVFPIFTKRIQLRTGTSFLLLCMAMGKALGSLYQMYFKA